MANKILRRDMKRSKPFRQQKQRFLIICEGETEALYFARYRQHLRLPKELVVSRTCTQGRDPSHIFEEAVRLFKQEKKSGDCYDRVYCVFDRDNWPDFSSTIKQIKELDGTGKVPITPITSTPCFELWYLLHFGYTSSPRNCCNQLVKELESNLEISNQAKLI